MNEIIFNDGKKTEIQTAKENGGALRIRMILKTQEELRLLFGDALATAKMTVREDGMKKVFENYDKLSYIKMEAGGIWEVEMLQEEADVKTQLKKLKEQAEESDQKLEMAIAEMTMIMASMMQGGEESVQ